MVNFPTVLMRQLDGHFLFEFMPPRKYEMNFVASNVVGGKNGPLEIVQFTLFLLL